MLLLLVGMKFRGFAVIPACKRIFNDGIFSSRKCKGNFLLKCCFPKMQKKILAKFMFLGKCTKELLKKKRKLCVDRIFGARKLVAEKSGQIFFRIFFCFQKNYST
jgi:hypothetical protein